MTVGRAKSAFSSRGVPSSSDRSFPPGLASFPLLLRACSHRHRMIPPGHPIHVHHGDERRRTLGAEELARDVEGLAADNNDLLTAQQLLGDDGGQAAEEVALAINDDLWEGERVSGCAQGGWFGGLARGIATWPGDIPKLLSWCASCPARCDRRGGQGRGRPPVAFPIDFPQPWPSSPPSPAPSRAPVFACSLAEGGGGRGATYNLLEGGHLSGRVCGLGDRKEGK